MTRDNFQSMSYQEQWFYLVDWTANQYKNDQYLYHALYVLIETYGSNHAFDDDVMENLHYSFD